MLEDYRGQPEARFFSEPVRKAIRLPRRIVVFSEREKYLKGLSLCLIRAVTTDEYLNRLSSLGHEHMNVRTVD